MRKIGDVLRLHAGGLSKRRIAVSVNIGRTAVGDYINRAGLDWPLPEDISDENLERLRCCHSNESQAARFCGESSDQATAVAACHVFIV